MPRPSLRGGNCCRTQARSFLSACTLSPTMAQWVSSPSPPWEHLLTLTCCLHTCTMGSELYSPSFFLLFFLLFLPFPFFFFFVFPSFSLSSPLFLFSLSSFHSLFSLSLSAFGHSQWCIVISLCGFRKPYKVSSSELRYAKQAHMVMRCYGVTPVGDWGSNGKLGIEPMLTACKASVLHVVLLL